MKVVVIGGGPAGMMSAITSAENGNRVIIFEKMNSLGRKLLITGKGRCNITSALPIDEFIEDADAGDAFQCQKDDLEVFTQTLVLDVLHVQFQFVGHHLLYIHTVWVVGIAQEFVLVDVFYRGIVGDAWLHVKNLPLFWGVHLHVFPHLWPGTHKAHVAFQHIQ